MFPHLLQKVMCNPLVKPCSFNTTGAKNLIIFWQNHCFEKQTGLTYRNCI